MTLRRKLGALLVFANITLVLANPSNTGAAMAANDDLFKCCELDAGGNKYCDSGSWCACIWESEDNCCCSGSSDCTNKIKPAECYE